MKLKNFGGLVLFCIDADFCVQILILQHFSRTTRFAILCTFGTPNGKNPGKTTQKTPKKTTNEKTPLRGRGTRITRINKRHARRSSATEKQRKRGSDVDEKGSVVGQNDMSRTDKSRKCIFRNFPERTKFTNKNLGETCANADTPNGG